MNNITELKKQRQELLDRVAELEKQIVDNSKYPEHGQEVYLASLSALDRLFCSIWDGNNNDKRLYDAGLVKPTSEEATEVSKKIFYQNWFASLSDVTPEMWKNITAEKYYAFIYYSKNKTWHINYSCAHQAKSEIAHFTTIKKLTEAIATIGGEEILKKYVLGVDEC